MNAVYPQQFACWQPGQTVIWIYPVDLDVAYHYKDCKRIQLKPNALYRAAFDANEWLNTIFHNR